MKRLLKTAAAICLSAGMCLAFSACGSKKTETVVPPDETDCYAIITKLDLNVEFDGDVAVAKVKNTFTFFPAEARVHVYLYYSETKVNSFEEMIEVATGFTEDLDQGKTLCASWDTAGRGGYFLARMRYKIDSREWEERVTESYYRDYTAVILEPIYDDGSLPVFEDTEPVYRRNLTEAKSILYENYCEFDALTSYVNFADKYEKKFNSSLTQDFFVFKLEGKYDFTVMPNYVEYEIFKEGDKLFFRHDAMLDVKDYGYNPPLDTDPTGIGRWNIGLSFNFVNIDKELGGKLKLEFVEIEFSESDNYINLYIGDFCIGTCYYTVKTEKDITYAFFYNLFVEYLNNNLIVKI